MNSRTLPFVTECVCQFLEALLPQAALLLGADGPREFAG